MADTDNALALITSDPTICHGQACVCGTRVPVSVVLDCIAGGMTAEQITAEYPALTIARIRAAGAACGATRRDD